MKLYYAPGTCSLASHIALHETGSDFTLEKVDLRSKVTASGEDYRAVNPKGSVPALEVEPGVILTEGAAIQQFVADRKGGAGVVPAVGTLERGRLHEALHFIGAELHKAYSPLFNPAISDEQKALQHGLIAQKLTWLESRLADEASHLVGATFTLADSYLFTITNWSKGMGIDMSAYPKINALRARVAARPAVQAAMKAEGLI